MPVSSASGVVSLSKGSNIVNPDTVDAILNSGSSIDFYIAGWDSTNAKWIAMDGNGDAVSGYDQLTIIEPDKGYLIYFDDAVDDAALASLSTALAESMTLVLSESRMSETAADTCEDCSGVDNPCTMQECWGINSNCVSIWFMAEACFTGSGSSLDEGDVCDSERQCGNKCPSREYYYLTNSDKWYCGACGEILDGEESISGCLRAGFVPSECECEVVQLIGM